MQATIKPNQIANRVSRVLVDFTKWVEIFGETSHDHQSFFAGPVGRQAKSLYYRKRVVGTAAVAPMIFCEAFLPSARRLFHQPTRFPIADAHYAMGFAFLFQVTNDEVHLRRATHFLGELKKSRSPGFEEYCWGYPYDWVTRNGTIKEQTPLITTTPYVYEAFLQVSELVERTANPEDRGQPPAHRGLPSGLEALQAGSGPGGRTEDSKQKADDLTQNQTDEWKRIMQSIARHAAVDIKDFRISETASSCSYTPYDSGGVINAAAYRAFLLTSASRFFSNDDYWKIAERNLNFVLENQNSDGSWSYAVDGVRDFVDHYHTCFVMKALAKVHALTGHAATLKALGKGVSYYQNNLFDADGLPKPFSRAPRLTVYKRELYDCAECINLCLLLRDRFPQLETTLETVVKGILKDWIKPDGSFRSRRLHLGWDNVPMHRWGQAQMFRSLAFYLREAKKAEILKAEMLKQREKAKPETARQKAEILKS